MIYSRMLWIAAALMGATNLLMFSFDWTPWLGNLLAGLACGIVCGITFKDVWRGR